MDILQFFIFTLHTGLKIVICFMLCLFALLFTIHIICPLVFSAALFSEFTLFNYAKPTIHALQQSKTLFSLKFGV